MKPSPTYQIIALSDLHCGDQRFDEALFKLAIQEINELRPDLLVVGGDLTVSGYREQFIEAKEFIDSINCDKKVIIAGNHDCRNVGYVYFEKLIGPRYATLSFDFGICCGEKLQKNIRVVAADSNKPDLNDGEVGRAHYGWIQDNFPNPEDFKVFIMHHHLVSVPGTGRERNIVWDAGDVLATLDRTSVDLVLCGHKHVPHIWQIHNMLIINSGTVSTHRTRGYTKPSYNVIDIKHDSIDVCVAAPGGAKPEKHRFLRFKAFPNLEENLLKSDSR